MHRIMVVDDEEIIVSIMDRLLTMHGFEVIKAVGGEAALEVLRSDVPLHLMILDMRMPKVCGIDVLKAAAPRKIPALFLTGTIDIPKCMDEIRDSSVTENDILSKPIDLLVLLAKVKEKLELPT